VNNNLALITDHEVADFALGDTGEKTLVNELTTGFAATLKVLTGGGGSPVTSALGIGAVIAEGEELLDGVVLDVVVVHLHKLDVVVVAEGSITKMFAVLLVHEPDEPNTLTSRATVLLDDAGLESASLSETSIELLSAVVSEGINETALQVGDLDESVLGTHLGLNNRRRPYELALIDGAAHHLVEALLSTRGGTLGELSWVDSDDECIVLSNVLGELVVVPCAIKEHVAVGTSLDAAIGDGDGVNTVAIRSFVGTTVGVARNLELHNADVVLGVGGLRHQHVVTLGSSLSCVALLTVSSKTKRRHGSH